MISTVLIAFIVLMLAGTMLVAGAIRTWFAILGWLDERRTTKPRLDMEQLRTDRDRRRQMRARARSHRRTA